MIGRRMANIIKRFARHRDDMRLANFQRVRGLDAEWKLLRCPTEYCLPNLTPLWANRNLGANRSDVVSGGIFKRDVNVAVCFHFCVDDAASESIQQTNWLRKSSSKAVSGTWDRTIKISQSVP